MLEIVSDLEKPTAWRLSLSNAQCARNRIISRCVFAILSSIALRPTGIRMCFTSRIACPVCKSLLPLVHHHLTDHGLAVKQRWRK